LQPIFGFFLIFISFFLHCLDKVIKNIYILKNMANINRNKMKLIVQLKNSFQHTCAWGRFWGGTSCLYLHAIRSRPKVGVYIPVTLKFWPGGTSPPPPSPPHAHVWLLFTEIDLLNHVPHVKKKYRRKLTLGKSEQKYNVYDAKLNDVSSNHFVKHHDKRTNEFWSTKKTGYNHDSHLKTYFRK